MNASFEEKSVWVQLIAMLLVMGGYFVVAGGMMAEGVTAMPAYAGVFLVTVVAQVVVLVAGYTLVALAGLPREPEDADERDRLIDWRSESRSAWIVGVGSLTAVTAMVFEVQNVWVAHILLLSMFLSELVKNTLQLMAYRRGF